MRGLFHTLPFLIRDYHARSAYLARRSAKTGSETDDAERAIAHPSNVMDLVAIIVAVAAFALLLALVEGLDRV